jgi:hypothetical protein
LKAAVANRVQHFVYVSVAHPAPVMKAYVEVRMQCEESGLNTTILRPWYVPGHDWPYLLKPGYRLGAADSEPAGKRDEIGVGDRGADGDGIGCQRRGPDERGF